MKPPVSMTECIPVLCRSHIAMGVGLVLEKITKVNFRRVLSFTCADSNDRLDVGHRTHTTRINKWNKCHSKTLTGVKTQ